MASRRPGNAPDQTLQPPGQNRARRRSYARQRDAGNQARPGRKPGLFDALAPAQKWGARACFGTGRYLDAAEPDRRSTGRCGGLPWERRRSACSTSTMKPRRLTRSPRRPE